MTRDEIIAVIRQGIGPVGTWEADTRRAGATLAHIERAGLTIIPATADEAEVERVARALSEEDEDGWARLCSEIPATADRYRDEARAACASVRGGGS